MALLREFGIEHNIFTGRNFSFVRIHQRKKADLMQIDESHSKSELLSNKKGVPLKELRFSILNVNHEVKSLKIELMTFSF